MWFAASVPFWAMGVFWLCAAVASVTIRYPTDTPVKQGSQMLISLVLAGLSFVIAAKVAT